jgi:WD40 repeat protein
MFRILFGIALGVALFVVGMRYLNPPVDTVTPATGAGGTEVKVTPETQLGDALYSPAEFPAIEMPIVKGADPIVIHGHLSPLETQDAASRVNGQLLFVGERIEDGAVQVAGAAGFMTEPFYFASMNLGGLEAITFYRRIYDGDMVSENQVLAMVDPTKAVGTVREKQAKLQFAYSEIKAAEAGADEGKARFVRADALFRDKKLAAEEWGQAKYAMIKLIADADGKKESVKVSLVELDQALADVAYHEVRSKLPYKRALVKLIQKQRGNAVREGETVMQLQNLDRLLAEGMLEVQYLQPLQTRGRTITATIEPTQVERRLRVLRGHRGDVTSLAVSQFVGEKATEPLIVSGSEDQTVCVWQLNVVGPVRMIEQSAAVRVVACSPAASGKNLALAGCADGTIMLIDLDDDKAAPITLKSTHESPITALAFSPDGAYFASGCEDGAITLWKTTESQPCFRFDADHGVAQPHQSMVTSLNFTPQGCLVSASRDSSLRVWRMKAKGAVLSGKVITGREGNVTQLGVSQDGKYMLFDQGRTLQLLSVAEGKTIHTLQSPGGSTPFDTLALFSPDSSLILTAGAPEGRLQLWRTPTAATRGYEVCQYVTEERFPVSCAAFAPNAGKGGVGSFAVSASKGLIYAWPVPGDAEINQNRIENVRMTLINQAVDPGTRQVRIGFEVANPPTQANPNGRFVTGRPVTIVID